MEKDKGSFIEAIKPGNEIALTLKSGFLSGKVVTADEDGILLEFEPGSTTFIKKVNISHTQINWKG